MTESDEAATRSIDASVRLYKDEKPLESIAAGLRGIAWGLLYVGEQIQRIPDSWDED